MWILTSQAEERVGSQAKATQTQTPIPEPRVITQVDKAYTIGRQNCDIIVGSGGPSSVSRHHATLHVGKSDASAAPALKLEDKSKFGLFCNDVKVEGTVSVSDGAVIRFGVREAKHAIFRCDWVRTKLCLTSFDAQTSKQITATAAACGIAAVTKWSNDCTHFLCNEVTFKIKTFHAVVHGAHIVTPAWLENLVLTSTPQDASSYIPSFASKMTNLVPQLQSSMLEAQRRSVLFSGILFLVTEELRDAIGEVLKNAGAQFKLCSDSVDEVEREVRALPSSTQLITITDTKSVPGSWRLRSEELQIPTLTAHELWGHVLRQREFEPLKVSHLAAPAKPPTPQPASVAKQPSPEPVKPAKPVSARKTKAAAKPSPCESPSAEPKARQSGKRRRVARMQSDDEEEAAKEAEVEKEASKSRAMPPPAEVSKEGSGDSPVEMVAQKRASGTCKRARETAAEKSVVGAAAAEDCAYRPKPVQTGGKRMPVSEMEDALNYKAFKKQSQSMQHAMAEIVPLMARGMQAKNSVRSTEAMADDMFDKAASKRARLGR